MAESATGAPAVLHGRGEHRLERLHVHRLQEVLERPSLDRRNRRLHGPVGRDNHHRQVGVVGLDPRQRLQTVQSRKLDVQHGHVEPPRLESFQPLGGVVNGLGGVAHGPGQLAQCPADPGLVVHDQDVRLALHEFHEWISNFTNWRAGANGAFVQFEINS